MNRQDMVVAAARALHRYCNGRVSFDHDAWAHKGDAAAVLDAVLPQITTVEQIQALPPRTVLMSIDNAGGPHFYRWLGGWILAIAQGDDEDYAYLNEFLQQRDTVMVVWRP
jgi:hypothetical protein